MRGAGEEIRLRGLCEPRRGRRRVDAGRRAHPGRLGLCAHGGPRGPHRAGGALRRPRRVREAGRAVRGGDRARAYDVCRDCDVGLHCLFQRRSDTSYKALLDRLPAEGAPRTIRCVFRDHPTPPRAFLESCGGDVYHDLATHDLDFALAALRKATGADGVRLAPDEVYAVGLDAAFAAVITVTWRALGVAGTFEVARASAYGYDQRCEVWTATGAALSVGNHVATSLEVGGAAGVVSSQLVESFPERFRAALPRTSRTARAPAAAAPRRRCAAATPSWPRWLRRRRGGRRPAAGPSR